MGLKNREALLNSWLRNTFLSLHDLFLNYTLILDDASTQVRLDSLIKSNLKTYFLFYLNYFYHHHDFLFLQDLASNFIGPHCVPHRRSFESNVLLVHMDYEVRLMEQMDSE
jgi:hypothetical protein